MVKIKICIIFVITLFALLTIGCQQSLEPLEEESVAYVTYELEPTPSPTPAPIPMETPAPSPHPMPAPAPPPAYPTITIAGDEFCTSLTELSLFSGDLSNEDIESLRYMTNLTSLNLWIPQIYDISPLSELTNLEELTITDGVLSDIAPLATLTNLRVLNLQKNEVSDLTPLSELENLEELNMTGNLVENLSPLSNLNNLRMLNLNTTLGSDINFSMNAAGDVAWLVDCKRSRKGYLSKLSKS